MSYDGYTQILCKNGHQRSAYCYEMVEFNPSPGHEDRVWVCSCGAKAVWWNNVNTTNGMYCPSWSNKLSDCRNPLCCDDINLEQCRKSRGRIDGYVHLEIDRPEEIETCKCCGHSKVVKEKTYKIPEGVGHRV